MNAVSRSSAAAALLAVPVIAETVHLIGDQWWGDVLFASSQLVAWALLVTVARQLAAVTPGTGRWGPRLVLVGTCLQAAFAASYLVSSAVAGEPSPLVWPVFLAGFLLLTAGGLTWARRLRRLPGRGVCAAGLAGVAALGLAAMVVASDPGHDIALVGSYLAWIAVGRGVAVPAVAGAGLGPVIAGWR
jgi:hypothetical protein